MREYSRGGGRKKKGKVLWSLTDVYAKKLSQLKDKLLSCFKFLVNMVRVLRRGYGNLL